MNNAGSTNTLDVLARLSDGVHQLGRHLYQDAYADFWSVVCALKDSSADTAMLLEAYDYAETAAVMASREPTNEQASSWLELALVSSNESATLREKIIRKSTAPEYEMRGRLLAQLQLLAVEHLGLKNFEKTIEFAGRSRKFQEDYREDGAIPMFHLSTYANEAMALFRLGRLSEAMDVLNKGLYSWDPETLADADGLKCFAKLCEFKVTVLRALAKKKLN